MRLLQTLLLSALFALSPAAYGEAAGPTAQELVTAVESTYKDVQSMQADFVQTTRSAMGAVEQRGAVQLKRPRKMRWDFTAPTSSSFITDGQNLWVWSAADNQVIISEDLSGATSGNDMTQLLDDLGKLGELFEVKRIDNVETSSYTLELTPKSGSTSFKQLHIVIARQGYTLQRVVMVDSFDGVVELDFSAVKLNATISDDRFIFAIPEGASVIRTDGI